MGEIKTFRRSGKFPLHALIELRQNPDLKDVQVVCHWKGDAENPGGYTTIGWSGDMTPGEMIFGARHLALTMDQIALGE